MEGGGSAIGRVRGAGELHAVAPQQAILKVSLTNFNDNLYRRPGAGWIPLEAPDPQAGGDAGRDSAPDLARTAGEQPFSGDGESAWAFAARLNVGQSQHSGRSSGAQGAPDTRNGGDGGGRLAPDGVRNPGEHPSVRQADLTGEKGSQAHLQGRGIVESGEFKSSEAAVWRDDTTTFHGSEARRQWGSGRRADEGLKLSSYAGCSARPAPEIWNADLVGRPGAAGGPLAPDAHAESHGRHGQATSLAEMSVEHHGGAGTAEQAAENRFWALVHSHDIAVPDELRSSDGAFRRANITSSFGAEVRRERGAGRRPYDGPKLAKIWPDSTLQSARFTIAPGFDPPTPFRAAISTGGRGGAAGGAVMGRKNFRSGGSKGGLVQPSRNAGASNGNLNQDGLMAWTTGL